MASMARRGMASLSARPISPSSSRKRIDRFLDARAAQRLDLVGDLAQLIFQSGQVLRRQRRRQRRRRAARPEVLLRLCRGGAASPLSARWRAAISATARSSAGGNCTFGIAGEVGARSGGAIARAALANSIEPAVEAADQLGDVVAIRCGCACGA